MNKLTRTGLVVMVVSGVLAVWGYWYISNHALAGLGTMFGKTDSVYSLAAGAQVLGTFAFVVGLVVTIIGAVQSSQKGHQ